MRMRTSAPEAADIDFFALQRLEDLPPLQRYVEACDDIGQHIDDLDRDIPRASERYSSLWRGYQGTTTTSLRGQEFQAPEVVEARQEVQELQDQLRTLHENAAAARAELETAKAELRAQLRPAMRQQLGPPLDALIRGLESVGAIERLAGQVPGHGQGRQIASAILDYLQGVHNLLQGDM